MSGFNMDDYVPVNERIEAFYAKHPEGSLQADIVERTEDRVTVKAYAYRTPDDIRPGTGLSSERIPGSTSFTKGSELENAETSAWGRAIAALGFEVKRGIASREEMRRNEQPQGGERVTRSHGRRSGASQPARTRPAASQRSAEEQALLDRILAEPQMTHARMTLMADAVGVPKGQHATVEQLREMVARFIETPAGGVPPLSAGTGQAGGSVPPAPPDTASSEGSAEPSLPGAGSASTTPTDAVAVSPPAAASGPTLDEVLAASGGELVPPRPGTDPYKALTAAERAQARAYWQREDAKPQPTLAEAMGGVPSD